MDISQAQSLPFLEWLENIGLISDTVKKSMNESISLSRKKCIFILADYFQHLTPSECYDISFRIIQSWIKTKQINSFQQVQSEPISVLNLIQNDTTQRGKGLSKAGSILKKLGGTLKWQDKPISNQMILEVDQHKKCEKKQNNSSQRSFKQQDLKLFQDENRQCATFRKQYSNPPSPKLQEFINKNNSKNSNNKSNTLFEQKLMEYSPSSVGTNAVNRSPLESSLFNKSLQEEGKEQQEQMSNIQEVNISQMNPFTSVMQNSLCKSKDNLNNYYQTPKINSILMIPSLSQDIQDKPAYQGTQQYNIESQLSKLSHFYNNSQAYIPQQKLNQINTQNEERNQIIPLFKQTQQVNFDENQEEEVAQLTVRPERKEKSLDHLNSKKLRKYIFNDKQNLSVLHHKHQQQMKDQNLNISSITPSNQSPCFIVNNDLSFRDIEEKENKYPSISKQNQINKNCAGSGGDIKRLLNKQLNESKLSTFQRLCIGKEFKLKKSDQSQIETFDSDKNNQSNKYFESSTGVVSNKQYEKQFKVEQQYSQLKN